MLPARRICCREIKVSDIEQTVNLLSEGFPTRTRQYWVRGLDCLSEHLTPSGFPKYGYLLECDGVPVGVILLIFSFVPVNGVRRIRCSVSSWYVKPAFRIYATLLASHALKHKHVTYFNISPGRHTLPILEKQGYCQYSAGRLVAVPSLCTRSPGSRVRAVTADISSDDDDLPLAERELLLAHAKYGCLSLICSSANRGYPFIFLPRWEAGVVPFVPVRCAYLVYCQDLGTFVRFARPVGRFLAWRGFPLVIIDSNGPLAGLLGRYYADAPKFYTGPDRPRLGDLAYSERVVFGF
jgi:hypothetical protein